MVDLMVAMDGKETNHRIIVGEQGMQRVDRRKGCSMCMLDEANHRILVGEWEQGDTAHVRKMSRRAGVSINVCLQMFV